MMIVLAVCVTVLSLVATIIYINEYPCVKGYYMSTRRLSPFSLAQVWIDKVTPGTGSPARDMSSFVPTLLVYKPHMPPW